MDIVAFAVDETRKGEESGSEVGDSEEGEEAELEHENNLDCYQLSSVVTHEKENEGSHCNSDCKIFDNICKEIYSFFVNFKVKIVIGNKSWPYLDVGNAIERISRWGCEIKS